MRHLRPLLTHLWGRLCSLVRRKKKTVPKPPEFNELGLPKAIQPGWCSNWLDPQAVNRLRKKQAYDAYIEDRARRLAEERRYREELGQW